VRPDAPWRTPRGLKFLMRLAAVALVTALVWAVAGAGRRVDHAAMDGHELTPWMKSKTGHSPNVCGNTGGALVVDEAWPPVLPLHH
jgi:hypothetical protein